MLRKELFLKWAEDEMHAKRTNDRVNDVFNIFRFVFENICCYSVGVFTIACLTIWSDSLGLARRTI